MKGEVDTRSGIQAAKHGPLTLPAGHGHSPAEQLCHLLDHRKAQPRALKLAPQAAIDLAERLEQLGYVLLGDAYAGIGDADLQELGELVLGQLKTAHGPGAVQRADGASRNVPGAHGHQTSLTTELHPLESRL